MSKVKVEIYKNGIWVNGQRIPMSYADVVVNPKGLDEVVIHCLADEVTLKSDNHPKQINENVNVEDIIKDVFNIEKRSDLRSRLMKNVIDLYQEAFDEFLAESTKK